MHEYGKYSSLRVLNIKLYCSRWPLLPTEIICKIFEVVTKGAATESGLPECQASTTVTGPAWPWRRHYDPSQTDSYLSVGTGDIPFGLKI